MTGAGDRSRLALLAVGSRGDVQPIVALGAGLSRRGHRVRLATHALYEPLVRQAGLEFWPLDGSPRDIIEQSVAGGGRARRGARSPVRFMHDFREVMRPVWQRLTAQALAACAGSDAIVDTILTGGSHAAERLGLPFCQAAVLPLTPTSAFPAAIFPASRLGGPYNRLTHLATDLMSWLPMRSITNEARAASGLPRLGPAPPRWAHERRRVPVLYGFSPLVVPRPADWRPWHHVTGYWFLDRPGWSPPPALARFLAAGPAPVAVSFGSLWSWRSSRLLEVVLEALARVQRRGVLVASPATTVPESVFLIDDVAYEWLFPRVAAVVHHGGAGTTAAAIRAGVPNVVVPILADQPFWAARVAALGVGPPAIPGRELTAEGLAARLGAACGDSELADRAARLGERIHREDGVACAAEAIEAWLADQTVASM